MAKWLRKWRRGWLYVRSNTKNAVSLIKHMTRNMIGERYKYYEREKEKKIIYIECGIIHWNWLRLAFRMTKSRKLPGALPPEPVRPQWAPPTCQGNMRAWVPLEFLKICTCHNLCFEKKIHNKVRQAIEKLKKYDLGCRFWSNTHQLAKNVFCDWTYIALSQLITLFCACFYR